jgi:hypothetical protein
VTDLYIRITDDGRHQPYRLVNGLYSLDVGPSFGTPREAIDYCKGQASRPRADDFAEAGASTSEDERPETGASTSAPAAGGPRTCVGCGGPIPPGSYRNRRTCSVACRMAVHRRENPDALTKNRARRLVAEAIARGDIQRHPCEDCGAEQVQAHHPNGYEGEAALDVIFLCGPHHSRWHPDHPGKPRDALEGVTPPAAPSTSARSASSAADGGRVAQRPHARTPRVAGEAAVALPSPATQGARANPSPAGPPPGQPSLGLV